MNSTWPWTPCTVIARKRNAFVGMVGAGLLRLDSRDKWALRIGGYYGTLARFNQYAARTISAATVRARTGLAKLDARHPGLRSAAGIMGLDSLVARH